MKNASVAARLGMKESEVTSTSETDEGLVIALFDGSVLIDVPDDKPDFDGKTGLMFLHRPPGDTHVSFPVYAREDDAAADADGTGIKVERNPSGQVDLAATLANVDPVAVARGWVSDRVEDGTYPDVYSSVAALVELVCNEPLRIHVRGITEDEASELLSRLSDDDLAALTALAAAGMTIDEIICLHQDTAAADAPPADAPAPAKAAKAKKSADA